ncbi:MAG: hypothetical protein C4547_04255 [Phycisphaerales bacterium]|nr:MAG: hypothetical protein C4547_04255 [Phycisphaerales bacterium]
MGDWLAAAGASGCVLVACWGRHRFDLATDPRTPGGAGWLIVASVGAALAAGAIVLTHALACASRQRVLCALTVGLVLGGLAALTGAGFADALTAACGSILIYLAFRRAETKRVPAVAAALALPVLLAWGWTASPWSGTENERPSYPTLWRQAQDVIAIVLPAALLAGLALARRCDLLPGARIAGWWCLVPFVAALLSPAVVVSFPLSASVGGLVVLPAGWTALRVVGAAPGVGLRVLGLVFLGAMALWLRPAAEAIANAVWIGAFPP